MDIIKESGLTALDFKQIVDMLTRKIHSLGKDRKPEDDSELWNLIFKYSKAGALLGECSCMHWLGEIYYGRKSDLTADCADTTSEAASWWQKAFEAGSGRSATNLGLLHLGKDIPGTGNYGSLDYDEAKAFAYFNKAYELGDSKAGRHIGLCYKNGTGVEANAEEAFKWFSLAADRGDSSAALFIADSTLVGIGTAQNVQSAIEQYKALVECKGHDEANAASALAHIYREGKYVPVDIDLSNEYYKIVISAGTMREQDIIDEAKKVLGLQ